jgi:hypothetical protein
MPVVTRDALVLLQCDIAARTLTQLLPGLYAELLLYGTFIATTFLTIRALLFVRKTPYQCWKSQWRFVLAACVMFIIGTCDVALAIWINSLLVCTDSGWDEERFSISYINYSSIHV